MAGTAPSPVLTTYQDHQLLVAADLNGLANHMGQLFDHTMGGFKNHKPVAAAVTNTSHSVTSGVDSFLSFDGVYLNSDGMWTSAHAAQFTINTAGWYRINFQVHFDSNTAAQRGCAILVNGTSVTVNAVASDSRNCNQAGAGSEGTTIFCEAVTQLAVGAIVHPYITQNSGSTVAVTTTFSGTFITFEWVAPY
jgi:hypothetical protein